MDPIKKLARILTDEVHGEFHVTLEAEDGQTFRVRVTEAQITSLIQELEELLRYDEEDDLTERKELGDE